MNKQIVTLGVCRERMGYYEHTDSLLMNKMFLAQKGFSVGEIIEYPTYIRLGRENIVKAFLTTEATHLCFVDSDNVLHPETIWRLLEHDLPVVGATYFKRRGAPEVVACIWADEERTAVRTASPELQEYIIETEIQPAYGPTVFDELPDPLMEIDGVGFGCTLIKREVLEKIIEINGNVFGGHHDLGEDLVFSRRAQDAGYCLYLDRSLYIGHITNLQVSLRDFMAVKEWRVSED